MDIISETFDRPKFQEMIRKELPNVILQADLEASEYSSSGLVKGQFRKKHIITLLTKYFGKDKIRQVENIPDIDVIIDSTPLKIRTITGKSRVKVKWTTGSQKIIEYIRDYEPSCGILLTRKKRFTDTANYPCGLIWIPLEAQLRLFDKIGLSKYLITPKQDTNFRGIELSTVALNSLLQDNMTKIISINNF